MNVTETAEDKRRRRSELLRRGQWRTEVEIRRRELGHRLEIAVMPPDGGDVQAQRELVEETIEAVSVDTRVTLTVEQARPPRRPSISTDVQANHAAAARGALEDAGAAIDSPSSLKAWWTGTAVTMAWESVHDAEGELVQIESEDIVRATLPRLRTWIHEVVTDKDLLDRYDKQLTAFMDGAQPIDRTVVHQAHHVATSANNDRHAALRTFRNLIVSATVVLTLLLIALAVWHGANPNFVSLCGTGSQCLAGAEPMPRDVAEIEIVGAIGGLLSVAFGLGSTGTAPSRYNVRGAQAALKPVAGAATALIGVLLVESHILVAPAERTSESLLLAYAAVFGFSQQLLTQFVDKRAGKLLEPDTKPEKQST